MRLSPLLDLAPIVAAAAAIAAAAAGPDRVLVLAAPLTPVLLLDMRPPDMRLRRGRNDVGAPLVSTCGANAHRCLYYLFRCT